MNAKQRVLVVLWIVIAIAMFLYPPWIATGEGGGYRRFRIRCFLGTTQESVCPSQCAHAVRARSAMVAYRLHRAHAIGVPLWQRLRAYYRNRWLESRQTARDRARVTTGGPSYYTLRRHQAGRALVDLVRRNLRGGAFTTTEAGTVIGVGPKSVDGVLA